MTSPEQCQTIAFLIKLSIIVRIIIHAQVAELADLPAYAYAEMAELVDALALGASGIISHGSSSLPLGIGVGRRAR